MAGRGQSSEHREGTPRGELARMRQTQERQSAAQRERIMEAMLEACGELGYRTVSVQDVLDRYGGYRVQFYRHFGSKADCYAAAFSTHVDRLCAKLLETAAAEPSWRHGLRAALRELSRFVCERPELARGLLVEVHVAGGPALAKRQEVLERLSRAVDGARRETESRHSPPPITATFMVGVIGSAVTSALTDGVPQDFADAVPELAHTVVAAYFDEEAAAEEMAVLRVA